VRGELQQVLFTPGTNWAPPKVSELPCWGGASRLGLDIETRDPDLTRLGPGVRRGAEIVGVSFCLDGATPYYLPVAHLGEGNLDRDLVFRYLRDQVAAFRGRVDGANLLYDLDFLAEAGVVFDRRVKFHDVQVAEPLINELHFSYSLSAIAERRGMPNKDESLLKQAAEAFGINPKREMWKLPPKYVGPYAEWDAKLPGLIADQQMKDVADQDLGRVYEMESRVLPITLKMRRHGIRVNFDKVDHVERFAEKEEKKQLRVIEDLTGVSIPFGATNDKKHLARALGAVGIKVPKTKSGDPEIQAGWLEHLDHDVGKVIRRAKQMDKLRTTFVKSVRDHAIGDRVHCTFNQLRGSSATGAEDNPDNEKGARYGRMSCADPNLQQQPSRADFGPLWRSIYVPDQGKLWCSADYSQQEPRMLVHWAEELRLWGATNAGDLYRNNPRTDSHTAMASIIYQTDTPTKEQRSHAKIIFLGLCYGMGPAKLATSLGLPTEWYVDKRGRNRLGAGPEARAVIANFNARVPFVDRLAELCRKSGDKFGYVLTLSGRRCRFPLDESGKNYDWTQKGLNRKIQGSSADQTKESMIALDEAGLNLQLQIHDENALSVRSRDEAAEVGRIMATCTKLRVPSKVDVEVGPSWGEAK
jgi:DNA polymerase I-like protein with 3'-5' exonuclease and polymerase domains